jgi:hypothetical protein
MDVEESSGGNFVILAGGKLMDVFALHVLVTHHREMGQVHVPSEGSFF